MLQGLSPCVLVNLPFQLKLLRCRRLFPFQQKNQKLHRMWENFHQKNRPVSSKPLGLQLGIATKPDVKSNHNHHPKRNLADFFKQH